MKGLNLNNDRAFFDLLGKGFIIVPRRVATYCTSLSTAQRSFGLVLLGLIFLCYHTDGVKELKFRRFTCKQGEYVGSYTHLGDAMGVSRYLVKKVIDLLCKHRIIEVHELGRAIRIRFTEYLQFLESCSATKKKDASEIGLDDLFAGLSGPSEEALRIAGEVKIPPLY